MMARTKVQIVYKSGRTVVVDSDQPISDLIRDMTTSHWFTHAGGAENMLEAERIKPMGGMAQLDDGLRRMR